MTDGEFSFVVVQYGTIDIVLLLTLLFFLIFGLNAQSTAQCYQQAIRQCGDKGNVKIVNVTRGITGVSLSISGGCQIECFERWSSGNPG